MLKFELHHNKAQLIEHTNSSEFEFLKKTLRIWKKQFKTKEDPSGFSLFNLYNEDENTFPAGFLGFIEKKCFLKKIKIEIDDKRIYPRSYLSFKMSDELPKLYETQKEALVAIKKNKTGVVSSVTGSGKTRLILETVVDKSVKTLIIVPSTSIQNQMFDFLSQSLGENRITIKSLKTNDDYFFKEFLDDLEIEKKDLIEDPIDSILRPYSSDEDYSKPKEDLMELLDIFSTRKSSINPEGDSNPKHHKEDLEDNKDKRYKSQQKKKMRSIKDVTIVCYQSLRTMSKYFLNQIDCVIIDECHHSSSNLIRNALLNMPNASYRFFFSATPWRDTKSEVMLLISAIGSNLIYELRGLEASERGVISIPKLVILDPPAPLRDLRKVSARNFRNLLEAGIICNSVRNKSIIDEALLLYSNQKNVFIAINEIKHLNILKERLESENITPIIVHGQLSDYEKTENIKKIGESRTGCISIGTMAVGEGTDMPGINAVILAAGGKSTIRFLQRIGRGTRKTESEFIVVDIKDWFHPTLFKHFRHREKTFRTEFQESPNSPLLNF